MWEKVTRVKKRDSDVEFYVFASINILYNRANETIKELELLKQRMKEEIDNGSPDDATAVIDDVQLCERLLSTIAGPPPAA